MYRQGGIGKWKEEKFKGPFEILHEFSRNKNGVPSGKSLKAKQMANDLGIRWETLRNSTIIVAPDDPFQENYRWWTEKVSALAI